MEIFLRVRIESESPRQSRIRSGDLPLTVVYGCDTFSVSFTFCTVDEGILSPVLTCT